VRKTIAKSLHLQGLGRHSQDEILWAPGSRRTREHMAQSRNLPAFCERMKQTYYGGHAS